MIEQMLKANSHSMEHVHEYIKLQATGDNETIAIKALENDPLRNNKVHVAENTMRRLVKTGSKADGYKIKAREVFKYAKGFE